MRSSPARRNMSVVDGRVHAHRSGSSREFCFKSASGLSCGIIQFALTVYLLVQDGLQFLVGHVWLIHDDVVVHRTSSSLQGDMRTEVEVLEVLSQY